MPGIWISKDLDEKQSVTASFFVSQQYFGGNKLIKQTIDSTIKDLYYNTRMIKAAGINLSLQYNYQVFSNLAFSAGLGYSKLNRALFQESMTNYASETFPTSKLSLKKPDLEDFVKINLITFKTGIIFNPGRFQLGANLDCSDYECFGYFTATENFKRPDLFPFPDKVVENYTITLIYKSIFRLLEEHLFLFGFNISNE